jgi:hypothetical protein
LRLTLQNELPLTVDRKRIIEFGPHARGGSFIKVGGNRYLVKESVEEILKAKE